MAEGSALAVLGLPSKLFLSDQELRGRASTTKSSNTLHLGPVAHTQVTSAYSPIWTTRDGGLSSKTLESCRRRGCGRQAGGRVDYSAGMKPGSSDAHGLGIRSPVKYAAASSN